MAGETDIDGLIEEGLRRYGLGDVASALQLLQQARERDPSHPKIDEYISYVKRAQSSGEVRPADLSPADAPLHQDPPAGGFAVADDWGSLVADRLPSRPAVIVEGPVPAPVWGPAARSPEPLELTSPVLAPPDGVRPEAMAAEEGDIPDPD